MPYIKCYYKSIGSVMGDTKKRINVSTNHIPLIKGRVEEMLALNSSDDLGKSSNSINTRLVHQ